MIACDPAICVRIITEEGGYEATSATHCHFTSLVPGHYASSQNNARPSWSLIMLTYFKHILPCLELAKLACVAILLSSIVRVFRVSNRGNESPLLRDAAGV